MRTGSARRRRNDAMSCAAAVAAVILAYHLAVSLIPLARLLALPPAQLASKYDL